MIMELVIYWIALVAVAVRMSSGTDDPSNLACTSPNSSTLTVTWTQASGASVAGYHLDVERVDGLKVEYGLPSVDLNNILYDSYTLYGLGTYAQYDVTVHSYLSDGSNGTDFVITCQTMANLPDAANFGFACKGISTSEIQCDWSTLDDVYWNGVAAGFALLKIGLLNAEYTEVNLTTTDLTYTTSGLAFDTWYIFHLRAINDVGYGPYSSDYAKTFGFPDNSENETRYFCYEAVPGTLEISWKEMPCTIYVGTILGLLVLTLIFMSICCCQMCCKGESKTKSNVAVNIVNEERHDHRYNDDDDDYEDGDDPYDDEDDDEGDEDSDESLNEKTILAKKKRKLAMAHKGNNATDEENDDDEDEHEDVEDDKIDEESEYKTSEVETEEEENIESDEDDEDLTEAEKAAKKEKKIAAIAAAKELREKKREEKRKRKTEKDAERQKSNEERKAERLKRNEVKKAEKAKKKVVKEKENEMRKTEKKKEKATQETEKGTKKEKEMGQSKKTDKNEDSETPDEDNDDSVSEDESGDHENKSAKPSKQKIKGKRGKPSAIISTTNEKQREQKKHIKGSKNVNKVEDNKNDKQTPSSINNKDALRGRQNSPVQNKRRRRTYSSESGSEADFYEDWNPDVEDNPDIDVTRINVNDAKTGDTITGKDGKEVEHKKKRKGNKARDKKMPKSSIDQSGNEDEVNTKIGNGENRSDKKKTRNGRDKLKKSKRKQKSTVTDKDSQDNDYSESDYDGDSDDSESDSYEDTDNESGDNDGNSAHFNKKSKAFAQTEKKSKGTRSKNINDSEPSVPDSGRESMSSFSNDWDDGKSVQHPGSKSHDKVGTIDKTSGSEANDITNLDNSGSNKQKKVGFFESLFGKSNTVPKKNEKNVKSQSNGEHMGDDIDDSDTNNAQTTAKSSLTKPKSLFEQSLNTNTDFGDWGSDDEVFTAPNKRIPTHQSKYPYVYQTGNIGNKAPSMHASWNDFDSANPVNASQQSQHVPGGTFGWPSNKSSSFVNVAPNAPHYNQPGNGNTLFDYPINSNYSNNYHDAGQVGPHYINNTHGSYAPQDPTDERGKFNDLFSKKSKTKALQKVNNSKHTIGEKGGQGNAYNRTNGKLAFTGDGEDMFAPKHGQSVDTNANENVANGRNPNVNTLNGAHPNSNTIIGTNPNGNGFNETYPKGKSLNGPHLNENRMYGTHPNGNSMNGIYPDGHDKNGTYQNGNSLNGTQSKGNSMNGSYTNGTSMNGKSTKGNSINGTFPNGKNETYLDGNKLNATNQNENGKNGTYQNGDSKNGTHPNGNGMNGTHPNGNGMNGKHPNGNGMNGTHPNGNGMNGKHPNGNGMNGKHPNGNGMNGTHPNGNGMNGTHPNGNGMNGTYPNGNGMNRTHPNGNGMNGTHPNGNGMNGTHPNGNGMNGKHPNGNGMNGTHPNGNGMNGTYPNGNGMNATHPNGNGMNGKHPNGNGMNGTYPNGNGMNGTYPNGNGMNGTQSNGNIINGTHPKGNGMNGSYANGNGMNATYPNGNGMNGTQSNGNNINGTHPNGNGMNGTHPNGNGMNGTQSNGHSMNGTHPNGNGMNGTHPNGNGVNRAYPNGNGINGAYPNGNGINGAYPNGNGMNGAYPNGNGLNGTYPKGDNKKGNNQTGAVVMQPQTMNYGTHGNANGSNNLANGNMNSNGTNNISQGLGHSKHNGPGNNVSGANNGIYPNPNNSDNPNGHTNKGPYDNPIKGHSGGVGNEAMRSLPRSPDFTNGNPYTHGAIGNAQNYNKGTGFADNPTNANKPRKLVSFRNGDKNNPNIDGQKNGIGNDPMQTRNGPNGKRNPPGYDNNNGNNFSDPVDSTIESEIILDDEGAKSKQRHPAGKFIVNKPAWNKPKGEKNNFVGRTGAKTPVEELNKKSPRIPLTEPAPVFDTDRLARKFPFLNEQVKSGDNGNATAAAPRGQNGMRKNTSDTALLFMKQFGPKGAGGQGSTGANGNTDNDNSDNVPSTDGANDKPRRNSGGMQPDKRDKVFYGFGVGRWRLMAAKWLNKWKMKRRPVKTVDSVWD